MSVESKLTKRKLRSIVSTMSSVHEVIQTRGVDEARRLAASKHERAIIDTAFDVISSEDDGAAYSHAGFAMTSLPHKQTDETIWRREGHLTTLIIQSGASKHGKHIGLPYGSLARLILLYLQSEAIRTNSPRVELGRSMNRWLVSMGLQVGGKTYKLVSDQAYRISTCNLAFISEGRSGVEERQNATFVDRAITMLDMLGDQPTLWQESVTLNHHFYSSLRDHPVPVSEAAIKAIGPRSLVIDLYIWLCWRLHALPRDQPVRWAALHAQFGSGYKALRQFKPSFVAALDLALAAYPDARVSVDADGIIMRPSRPAIAKL